MGLEYHKRKSWKNSHGVSDVIGNILILMITVVLFTSIMVFVNQIPVPEASKKTTFAAGIDFWDSGHQANLTVTHTGGQVLESEYTTIIVNVDGTNNIYELVTDPGLGGAEKWSTGMSWNTVLANTTQTSSIEVTIVDMEKHQAIWTSQVTGGGSGSPPSILQRYADANWVTPTTDLVGERDNFTLFVQIIDPDNDLDWSTVYVDSSQFEDGVGYHLNGARKAYNAGISDPSSGWFAWSFNVWHMNSSTDAFLMYDAEDLDGAVIWIHATDNENHTTVSTYMLSITIFPTNTEWYPYEPTDTDGYGLNFLPTWLTYKGNRQGCGIYGEDVKNKTANVKDARANFTLGENAYIRVGSLDLDNVLAQNQILVQNALTGTVFTPPSQTTGAFKPLMVSGSVHIFEAKVPTNGLLPGTYSVWVKLKSVAEAGMPEQVFEYPMTMYVTAGGSTIGFVPAMWFWSDSARTNLWGTSDKPFTISNASTNVIYASISVQDAVTPPSPTVDVITISDMVGGIEAYGAPSSGSMISALTKSTRNSTAYDFYIDLRYNNGNQWLGGLNAYALVVTRFSDANEGIYTISHQVYISSSFGKAHFFLGSSGINVGHANFDVKNYLMGVENNNFFSQMPLWDYTNTPSDKTTYTTTAIALGDLTGDGQKDILLAQGDDGKRLLYFKNTLNTYGIWQAASTMPRESTDAANTINCIAFGDIQNDGAQDFATSSSGNKVVIYNNTYGMTPKLYPYTGATPVTKIALRDMTNDGKADLIVMGGAIGSGKIQVIDLSRWGKSDVVRASIPDPYISAGTLSDFDIADVNVDGWLDIVTAGTNGVVVNYYSPSVTPTKKVLGNYAPYTPLVARGVADGDYLLTTTDDNSALKVTEDPVTGRANFTLRFEPLENDPEQTLVIKARLNSDKTENFVVMYSMDANGATGKYNPLFVISSAGTYEYTYWRMPSSIAGKQIYLRFIDLTADPNATTSDFIEIDYAVMLTKTYGKYTTSQVVVRPAADGWTCARAGNLNGTGNLEIVAAKTGSWAAYNAVPSSSVISGWSESNANIRVSSTLLTNTAPTLFNVIDVNGDTYSDVSVTYYSAVQSDVTLYGFWMNLWPSKVFFTVAELGRTGGAGSLTVTMPAKLIVTS